MDIECKSENLLSCGSEAAPCCTLQNAMDLISNGDVVMILQSNKPHQVIQAHVYKSFEMAMASGNLSLCQIHLSGQCDSCTVSVTNTTFLDSRLSFINVCVTILGCTFIDSSISAIGDDMRNKNAPQNRIMISKSMLAMLKYNQELLSIQGSWHSIDVMFSTLNGGGAQRQKQQQGVVMAKCKVLSIDFSNVTIKDIFSAIIFEDSAVKSFHISDSQFTGNSEGVNLGYDNIDKLSIIRSHFVQTGGWGIKKVHTCKIDYDSHYVQRCTAAVSGICNITIIEESKFILNIPDLQGQGCNGSAINFQNVPHTTEYYRVIEISNSVFTNNTALRDGKSCHSLHWDKPEIGGFGGAIAVLGKNIFVSIHGCSFKYNRAYLGGALFIKNSQIKIRNSTFQMNSAQRGGAAFIKVIGSDSQEKLRNFRCEYDSKSACVNPYSNATFCEWAVCLPSNTLEPHTTILIENTDFNGNVASWGGGALMLYSNGLFGILYDVYMTKIILINNIGGQFGGGMYILTEKVTIQESLHITLVGALIHLNSAKRGGGLAVYNKKMILKPGRSFTMFLMDSKFSQNKADEAGGFSTDNYAIKLATEASFVINFQNLSLIQNVAEYFGGGGAYISLIDCEIGKRSSTIISFSDFTCTNNRARVNGGGLTVYTDFVTLSASAIYNLTISECDFISNEAFDERNREGGIHEGTGGALSLENNDMKIAGQFNLEIIHCLLWGNTAPNGGGVSMKVESGSIEANGSINIAILASSFQHNLAEFGAGLRLFITGHYVGAHGKLQTLVRDSNFTHNSGRDPTQSQRYDGDPFSVKMYPGGAGIFVEHSSVTLATKGEIVFSFNHCQLVNNSGKLRGSGLAYYMNGINAERGSYLALAISASHFRGNKACLGGAVYLNDDNRIHTGHRESVIVKLERNYFQNNIAEAVGGALFLQLAYAKIHDCYFKNNSLIDGYGSAIYLSIVTRCNEARKLSAGTTRIRSSQFIQNKDTAIFLGSLCQSKSLIAGCKFIDNTVDTSMLEIFKAEDIESQVHLVVIDTHIVKYNASITSIYAEADAKFINVKVDVYGIFRVEHLTKFGIAHVFGHLIDSDRQVDRQDMAFPVKLTNYAITFTCPSFYEPYHIQGGVTEHGISSVKFLCRSFFPEYYMGPTTFHFKFGKQTPKSQKLNDHCIMVPDDNGNRTLLQYCYSHIKGVSHSCPYGADCSQGITALPQYWGKAGSSGQIHFHRCPAGYCCEDRKCETTAQCAPYREGTLCGQCRENFTEALFSPKCIENTECTHTWFIAVSVFWGFCLTIGLIFMGNIRDLVKYCCKGDQNIEARTDEERINLKSVLRYDTSASKENLVLGGVLAVKDASDNEQAGTYMYLQIIFFYIQDSTLMKVDLPLKTSISVMGKMKTVLSNISHLAVEVLDLGLTICPLPGWTPALKLVLKNSTGPLIMLNITVLYFILFLLTKCFASIKNHIKTWWYPNLAGAMILSLLLFYQKIATTTFSLLYCVRIGETWVLHIDGTVVCYELWQLFAIAFAAFWVIPIIPTLTLIPGMIETKKISTGQFFLTLAFPIPMFVYFCYKKYRGHIYRYTAFNTNAQERITGILQKPFVPIYLNNVWPICWTGIIKARRLIFVIAFTFVQNLIIRLILMILVTLSALILHMNVQPYKDRMANRIYILSLFVTIGIGLVNLVKAGFVEFLWDLEQGVETLNTLNLALDVVLIWTPICITFTAGLYMVIQKLGKQLKEYLCSFIL